jgi:hypothetical protein
MSDELQTASGSKRGDYPPEWIKQSKEDNTPITMWSTSPGGAVYLAVWRQFHDATQFEQNMAVSAPPGLHPFPRPHEGVARVTALREARMRHPEFSGRRWERAVAHVWPDLNEAQRQNADEIVAAIEDLFPNEPGSPVVVSAHGFTSSQIRKAVHAVRKRTDRAPTITLVAEQLRTSESTLKRAVKKLGLGPWPPSEE